MLIMPLMGVEQTLPLPAESVAYRRTELASSGLRTENKLRDYARYDFSPLWAESNKDGGPRGFIGPNYQRLRIRILTIKRDAADSTRYYLTGKTQVAGHVSAFTGVLMMQQIRELRHLALRIDETLSPAKREGIAFASYELREDPTQPKSGVFRGVLKTNWYVDKQGRFRYDDINGTGDGYCNNQFVGAWTSYATKKTLRCNWGDIRIPNSNGFDIGAGEFSPDPKYYPYGWQNFKLIWSESGTVGRQRENRENQDWWK